jgi:hypothetical protein
MEQLVKCEFCSNVFEPCVKDVVSYRFETPSLKDNRVHYSMYKVVICPKCRLEIEVKC